MNAYRIVLSVIDFEELGEEGIKRAIESTRFPNDCINPHVQAINYADIGDWHDGHPLNKSGTAKAEFTRLFAELEARTPAATVEGYVPESALLDLIADQCKDWPSMANVPQKGLLRLMRAAIKAEQDRLCGTPAAPTDPYAAITLSNLRAGKLTAARIYVGYCELKGELEAANGAIKRYEAQADELRSSAAPTDANCQWPMCQSKEVQEREANEVHAQLYGSTAAQSVRDALVQAVQLCRAKQHLRAASSNPRESSTAKALAEEIRALIQSPQPGEAE